MKTIIILAAALGLTLLCTLFSSPIKASEALDSLKTELQQQERKFDEQYGVLLTNSELTNLKLGLIVSRLERKQAAQPEISIESLVSEALVTYEIDDLVEQRQLLIQMAAGQVEKGTGKSGTEPPP